jgi:hypothetical protein
MDVLITLGFASLSQNIQPSTAFVFSTGLDMHTALPRKMQTVELSNPVITDVPNYQTRVHNKSKNSTN